MGGKARRAASTQVAQARRPGSSPAEAARPARQSCRTAGIALANRLLSFAADRPKLQHKAPSGTGPKAVQTRLPRRRRQFDNLACFLIGVPCCRRVCIGVRRSAFPGPLAALLKARQSASSSRGDGETASGGRVPFGGGCDWRGAGARSLRRSGSARRRATSQRERSSLHLSPGFIRQLVQALADGWIPVTSTGMTSNTSRGRPTGRTRPRW
jgi:hypothetical protein